jgi:hypothetical protein
MEQPQPFYLFLGILTVNILLYLAYFAIMKWYHAMQIKRLESEIERKKQQAKSK